MLAKARKRNLYTNLALGDICDVLEADTRRYDLVIAGDVLIYIGDLARLFTLIAERLTRGGMLAFSIEGAVNKIV